MNEDIADVKVVNSSFKSPVLNQKGEDSRALTDFKLNLHPVEHTLNLQRCSDIPSQEDCSILGERKVLLSKLKKVKKIASDISVDYEMHYISCDQIPLASPTAVGSHLDA